MIRQSRNWIIGLACLVGAVPSTALAVIRYVNAARPDDSGDGLSWATAEKNLQSALVVAGSGDEIWVAAGEYKPDQGGGQVAGNRNATFSLPSGVSIYGGFTGGETLLSERNANLNVCILSGDLNGNDVGFANNVENSRTVVAAGFVAGISPVLDGFTIMGGNEDGLGRGAGINIGPNTGPTVVNCTIQWNSANVQGGGVYFANTLGVTTFRGCRFLNNSSSNGGAVFGSSAELHLSRCIFSNNSANNGGAVYVHGALGNLAAANCFFIANSCSLSGGALYVGSPATANVTNCEFSGNQSDDESGAIEVNNAALNMANCTVVNNSADQFYGGLFGIMSTLNVSNSIFWGNTDTDGDPSTSQVFAALGSSTVSYSIIQDGWGGLGSNNLSSDPMFFNAGGNDYRVFADSPAVDSGDNAAVPADVTDLDGDADTVEPTPLALGQIARFEDNPNVSDANGSGTAPIVDRGAYEVREFNIIYVDADGPGPGDWATAFTKLQDALTESKASATSQIWVADGTYYPDEGSGITLGDRAASFQLLNGVELFGGFAGGETLLSQRAPSLHVATLSGDLAGNDAPVACSISAECVGLGGYCFGGTCIIESGNAENSYHVVTGSGTDVTAVVDGFTIRAGHADGPSSDSFGAGMRINTGDCTIRNCTFTGNRAAADGGGILTNLGGNPTISACMFRRNSANNGGGVLANSSDPIMFDCTFLANSAQNGAGMYAEFSSALLTDCTFVRNAAIIPTDRHGGGMLNTNSTPTLINCRFLGNSAVGGGGMWNINNSHAMLINCVFSGNSTTGGGAAIYNRNTSSPTLVNCTLSQNAATTQGGGFLNLLTSSPTLTNCIFWANSDAGGMDESAQIHSESGSMPTVSYSILQGGWTGLGGNNLNTDPMFVDPDGADNVLGSDDDDLRILSGSPAIDSGNTPALPADVFDVDGDANVAERIPIDFSGSVREYDDPSTPDTGVPGSPVVDMGAYEFFVDCNNNGSPDECDISCTGLGGACAMYAGCGGSGDCGWAEGFPNGIPDDCDLAGCGGNPDCDDCNLNGVPDACDIASVTSLDVNPADGIPDECSQFDATCIADTDWSCFDNWNIPGDVYPDNTGPTTYSVTLDETDDVFLDVDVTIDTLRIIDDAVLNVTQNGAAGDLTIAQPGGLLIDGGTLYINNGRTIDVTAGTFSVRNEGLYAKAPMARSTHGVSHDADLAKPASPGLPEATVQTAPSFSQAAPPEPTVRGFTEGEVGAGTVFVDGGGAVVLTGSMVMVVEGSLAMDGGESCTCCPCDPGECVALRGVILPPPKFRAADLSQTDVLGNMDMLGSVEFYYGSANNLDLNGDLNNASTNPGCFNWSAGGLTLGGSTVQTIEAAGRDLGATFDGFYYGPDTNFALGELEISAGRSAVLVNNRANTVGTGSCQEALYVHHLILRSNATLTLSDTRVYYETLTLESGATLVDLGCGESLEVASCVDAATCGDGDACTIDACDAGSCSNTPIPFLAYGDTVYTGVESTVDVDDILCVLDAFSGIFAQCPLERADLVPCANDVPTCVDDEDCSAFGVPCQEGRCRVLDVDDILAVLDAFSGINLCASTCP